ncbi:penicillin-binding protein activator [Alteriqipengyuania sp. WL0013]|uniref:penicillin-binding protein activator n=1 Tax=Alteriqipengyuania sp. WL0013 TaxID=3110773 RepID=UPI002BEEAD78|nr:penicillin-binding protein activator [Alteriqipengyuania sp. WL0013]MEB3414960.1 penicillin-binding protein activator [Alteriqipengyuania sp. WL0013]
MRFGVDRRFFVTAGLGLALGGCAVIPKVDAGTASDGGSGATTAPTGPTAGALPSGDETRHRIALLVPMTGANADTGQAIANATTTALLDTNASNLRITTYDTGTGAGSAAARAIADGNKLILGPLLSENVGAVLAQARPADVPLITFSNDMTQAARDVFVMGVLPGQSVQRTVDYARAAGNSRFAALIPDGEYGRRAELALRDVLEANGGQLVALERYERGTNSITDAAQRLRNRGGYDAVLIADTPRLSITAAGNVRGNAGVRILGTELWGGDANIANASALDGAWFSTVSDRRFRRFYDSYQQRFGSAPPRIATLGYDAVLLTLNVAQDWRVGRDFPRAALTDSDGFLGLDGAFRFDRNGVIERAMEVRQVRGGEVTVASEAPTTFAD